MHRLAVFASGNGSNFQAIAEAVQSGELPAEVVLVVCDKKQAYVIDRAESFGIETFVASPKDYGNKQAYEQAILEQCQARHVDMIILAGYMRLIGPTLLTAYRNKIINLHPSLLPSFPGLNAIEQAVQAGVKVTGVTVHYVDEGMDTGPIIAQEPVRIYDNDSLADIEARIHQAEHQLYPKTIANLLEKGDIHHDKKACID
ncbi:phosphoribosylglycinamide formyltransferase-1 [Scopulibacillus daqui]|uniref:Phosphoribosylglycinamide formyltransferase n=1 Tax=Scopulibacillus daqui TaxID=1469162 RepID=A0ABS2Q313_9BACL|nr:phosphoribosylglycinamide formyltransferase [Scopulibacillus daqui]MBM7646613.1 phosphoribosylglycinamide formyltransferase-1 [Scopulibacillus daqui]